jgi:hypothetical protein
MARILTIVNNQNNLLKTNTFFSPRPSFAIALDSRNQGRGRFPWMAMIRQ